MSTDHKATLTHAIRDESSFVRATFTGKPGKHGLLWRKVVVRPVLIKGARHLQFSYFDATKDITKNYRDAEAAAKLDELLAMPFTSIHLETTDQDLQIQITKSGKAIIQKSEIRNQKSEGGALDLSHDRHKELALPADRPDAFLQRLGIMNKEGKVAPAMQDKFTQINEFLKLLEHTGELDKFDKVPVNILDCGAGSSYLSFAVYHYLNDIKGISANLVGVDIKPDLIEKSNQHAAQLGLSDICFKRSAIIEYVPETPPDIVLALHACDTATDEAIAQGVLNNSRLILCVPCCHHDLNEQLHTIVPFAPVVRHGILKERMSDILTDALRALILRMMGYKTDVVEFVSTEHTPRNLMIRAVRRGKVGDKGAVREYEELKGFWGVEPYLEGLLRDKRIIDNTKWC